MANHLKMAEIHAILTLRARGWSFRRIARELGIHRETVAGYVRRAADALAMAGQEGRAASTSRSTARSAGAAARHAASGRRAHQMRSVEMCPCRMLFSRRACAETRLMGRSTSVNRLG